jgi:penicillin-binding protein 1A
LREALYESMNAVSIKLVQGMGVAAAVQHVKRFGFDEAAVPNDLSLALGAGGVAPLAVATGYATFANGGYKVTPYFIDRVTTADGELVYESKPLLCADCSTPPETPVQLEPVTPDLVSDITELYPKQRSAPRVISAQNAYLISDMLRDVITRGSGGRALALGRRDLAGKTGTTNDARDTWFVGFNANLVGAAWVGFDQFRPLGGDSQGGRTAIPMWIDFMREALAGTPERLPKRPPGIVEHRINPTTGLIAGDGTFDSIFEKFDVEHLPDREQSSGFVTPLDSLESGAGPRPSGEPIF